MARKGGGGGNVATQYLQTGLQILFFLAIGMFLIQVFAGLVGNIQSQFQVTTTNPLYNVTKTWQGVVNQVSGLVGPLVLLGIAIVVIAGAYVIWSVFHR
ncbi:MAG: hypothetical protein QXT28_09210 [Thermofilaceae archaeon]